MARTFSIITTCKGRLDHLKQSLPAMTAQGAKEVIVVDFSCPQGTGPFVSANFPAVRLVSVEGDARFSNWKARNAGASAAGGDVLLFVDADTLLAEGAIVRLSESLPDKACGCFDEKTRLKDFHAIPADAFRKVGGYDEVPEGYAAGAGTDLEERLAMNGIGRHLLDPALVQSVIEHDAASRSEHHAEPARISYCAALLYRSAKRMLLQLERKAELPLKTRRQLYETALKAAQELGVKANSVGVTFTLDRQPILMPRQLGFERGAQTLRLRVEVGLEGKLDATSD